MQNSSEDIKNTVYQEQINIDDDFSETTFTVLLSNEASKNMDLITCESFPELDIYSIEVLIDYYPEIDNKKCISITLNDSNKVNIS